MEHSTYHSLSGILGQLKLHITMAQYLLSRILLSVYCVTERKSSY